MIERKLMSRIPHDMWVTHLRKGNVVWLVKEEKFAEIAYPYEIEPGHIAGDVGIRVAPGHIQKWFIRSNGNGLDNKPLIHPVVGHVPAEPSELPPNDIRRLNREVERLRKRVDLLTTALQSIIDPSGVVRIEDVVWRQEHRFNVIDKDSN
jgi:hypothetical protein